MFESHSQGGCSCAQTRYQLKETPLIVHACHCRMCQKLSGSTNAINLLIEAENVHLMQGETTEMLMPTPSGHGQIITRCKHCRPVDRARGLHLMQVAIPRGAFIGKFRNCGERQVRWAASQHSG